MILAPLIAVSHFLNTALKDLRERPPEEKGLEVDLKRIEANIVEAIRLITPLVGTNREYLPYRGPATVTFAPKPPAPPTVRIGGKRTHPTYDFTFDIDMLKKGN